MYIYYPSCNYQKYFPRTAARLRAYLETQPDVRMAGCCHVTRDMPREGDTIVTVCMTCMHGLEEMRPEIPQISLPAFLLTRRDFPWPDLQKEAITLQDCFRARNRHELQYAARECLHRMNAICVEMPGNRDDETYDGTFLFHPPSPQNVREAPRYFGTFLPSHLTLLPPEKWNSRLRAHAALYTTRRVACYCNVCVIGARKGGADAWHLTELIWGS